MAFIYVITVILLIVCFVIIEKSLAKESKARISYLENQVKIRDNKLIEAEEYNKNLKFSIKLMNKVNTSLEVKFHRERDSKGHFIKKSKTKENVGQN